MKTHNATTNRQRIYSGSLRLRLFTGVRTNVGRASRVDSERLLKSVSIAIRVAVSSRLVLPGTLPRNALTSEHSQVGINLPSIILRHNWRA
jgi:hypothetical protein